MREKRLFRRIVFVANGVLQYQDQRFPCHVENISQNGALVGAEDAACELICQGGKCVLTLYQSVGCGGADLTSQVVHSGFGLVGLKFIELDAAQEKCLADIIEQAAREEATEGSTSSRLYARLGINADRERWE